jgi:hypothetical protein
MTFMEPRPYDVEKLLAAVRAFERVVESSEQLCQEGESLARLLGVFFAMEAAFAIRCSLAIGEGEVPEMAADSGGEGSGSTYAEQQSLPKPDAVRTAIPRLVAAVTSNNSAATVSALEEMGVLSLCPNPGEQLSRMERMTATVGSSARLVLLVEIALFAVELRDFDGVNRYVAEARTLSPSSWEFYNLCVLEGLLALKAGKQVEAVQWLERSSNACQVDEHVSLNCAVRAPNFLLAQELVAKGERSAVISHLLLCKYVWDYAQLPFDEWVDIIERGGIPDFQRSEAVQALNQPFWKLQTAWNRARCLEEEKGLPPTRPNSKSPAEVLTARKRLVEEQQRHGHEIVKRTIKYLDD